LLGWFFILAKVFINILIMTHLNVEIKAKCNQPEVIRKYLRQNKAEFKGIDYQTDTYFNVKNGRLKLREGNIENSLIYYQRHDQPNAKGSSFQLVNVPDAKALKDILIKSSGIKVIVEKKREIYFIKNVKFHIDEIADLGNFIEIEASNLYADVFKEELLKQCNFYLKEFGINEEDLIAASYGDMLMAKV